MRPPFWIWWYWYSSLFFFPFPWDPYCYWAAWQVLQQWISCKLFLLLWYILWNKHTKLTHDIDENCTCLLPVALKFLPATSLPPVYNTGKSPKHCLIGFSIYPFSKPLTYNHPNENSFIQNLLLAGLLLQKYLISQSRSSNYLPGNLIPRRQCL